MKKIPCVMMRGGTSRGAFLLAGDAANLLI